MVRGSSNPEFRSSAPETERRPTTKDERPPFTASARQRSSGASLSLDDTMPTRQLSAAEENEARKAFAMLQNKKLLTVNKRGRKASMAPVHAALAIRKGAFAKNRGASLSAESQLTAAATAYGGVPAKKIKEYLDLLAQCDAPESGARLLQTPFAARERLRRRAARVGLELADMTADGNCFYRAVAHIVIDLGVRSVGYRHSDVRRELADTLDKHQDDSLDGGITLASAALLATNDWLLRLPLVANAQGAFHRSNNSVLPPSIGIVMNTVCVS